MQHTHTHSNTIHTMLMTQNEAHGKKGLTAAAAGAMGGGEVRGGEGVEGLRV